MKAQGNEKSYYVGKCKNNLNPKHVTKEGSTEVTVELDNQDITLLYNGNKSRYVYFNLGGQWMWVEDADILSERELTTTSKMRIFKPRQQQLDFSKPEIIAVVEEVEIEKPKKSRSKKAATV